MRKTISDLWNGDIFPVEFLGADNGEARKLENHMHRITEKFKETLNEKQNETLDDLWDNMMKYAMTLSEQAFCDGFSLGTKMTAESFLRADGLVHQ